MSSICWGSRVPVNDVTPAKPVVLLGRAGPARERLHDAIVSAGGQIVLEEEPSKIDLATLEDAKPFAIIVALESAIEHALESLEPILDQPHLTVLYDDVETAAHRDQWQTQRWIRHLASKLQGHRHVLPPGHSREQTTLSKPLEPPAIATDTLPNTPFNGQPEDDQSSPPVSPSSLPTQSHNASADSDSRPDNSDVTAADVALDADVVQEPGRKDATQQRPSASSAVEDQMIPEMSEWTLEEVRENTHADSANQAARQSSDQVAAATGQNHGDDQDLAIGAVLLLAGLGGPDAIRRFLAALPTNFPPAVLIYVALEAGQFVRLAQQMSRVSTLPVKLAKPGEALKASTAYIVPGPVAAIRQQHALEFSEVDEVSQLITALPPSDSAVIILSGADLAFVSPVRDLASQGAWVGGQSADGCYDPSAALCLVKERFPSGNPAQLATLLVKRWPSVMVQNQYEHE